GGNDKVAATPPAATATAPAPATATATATAAVATATATAKAPAATATATAEKTPEATATPAPTEQAETKTKAPQIETTSSTKPSPAACMVPRRKPHKRGPNEWVGEDKPTGEDVLVTGPYKTEPEANDSADSQTTIASAEAGGLWVVTAPVLAHVE